MTWSELLAEAFGILRLRPEIFWDMTPIEYEYMAVGFAQERDRSELIQWKQTRWLAANIVNIVRGLAGAKSIDQRHLLPLPDDLPIEDDARNFMTKDRFEFLSELWNRKVN